MSNWTVSMRPSHLSDVYGCDNIKKFFTKKKREDYPNAVLLKGNFGSGKTTVAKILSMRMTCNHPKENGDACLECENCKAILNETYNRGNVTFVDGSVAAKDEVIDTISNFVDGGCFGTPVKVVIIDEAQELSTAAAKSLLKILETPKKKIHFILTSMGNTDGAVKTGSGKEVPKSIESRCQTFVFKKSDMSEIMFFLKTMLERQNLWGTLPKEFQLNGLQMIADNSNGSFRQALQTLEQCVTLEAFTPQAITENLGIQDTVSFYEMLTRMLDGQADDAMLSNLMDGDFETTFRYAYKVISDAACYQVFKKIPGDIAYFTPQASKLASHPNFWKMRNGFQRLSEKSSPYLKKADYVIEMCNIIDGCRTDGALNSAGPQQIAGVRKVKRG